MLNKTQREQVIDTLSKEFSRFGGGGVSPEEFKGSHPDLWETIISDFQDMKKEEIIAWVNNPQSNPSLARKAFRKWLNIASALHQASE
jgi:hypothetical protein